MTESARNFYSKNVQNQWHQYKEKNLADEFLEYRERFCNLVESGEILDAGCGPGRDVNYFVDRGLEATGIDISQDMIKFARNQNKGNYSVMDMRNLEFEAERFHGIWCSASIFFFEPESMKKVINQFYDILKNNGVLYIDFKQGEGQHVKEKWGSQVNEWHITSNQARNMIKASGFKIIDQINNTSNTGNKFIDFFCRKPKET